jgi:general L-amino acid transport system permease protein
MDMAQQLARSRRTAPWHLRLQRTLFADVPSALVSVAALVLMAWAAWTLFSWGVLRAVFYPDAEACRMASGACWGIVPEKYRLIVLGRFPYESQWRPVIGTLAMTGGVLCLALPRYWNLKGLAIFTASLAVMFVLMAGGVLGLRPVGTDLWGGLPLTLLLSVLGCLLAVPIGLLLALGRRSRLPAVRAMCIWYIETVRGIPLIAWLIFASFVLPLFLPPAWKVDLMLRVGGSIVFFAAAYLAEVFRGGLQAIPRGQYEAAHALGLNRFQTLTRIVIPQALRMTLGPTVNIVIGLLKDTALVSIVNLYDLTGTLKLALSSPEWHMFFVEAYIFVSSIYLALGFGISRYGRFLESHNTLAPRR